MELLPGLTFHYYPVTFSPDCTGDGFLIAKIIKKIRAELDKELGLYLLSG